MIDNDDQLDDSWEKKMRSPDGSYAEPYSYMHGVKDFQKRAIKVLSEQNWNNEDEKLACIEILENLTAFD